MPLRNPPQRDMILPGVAGCGSNNVSTENRSGGISPMAVSPRLSNDQNDSGSVTPPGNRQPMPTMAMGSGVLPVEGDRVFEVMRGWVPNVAADRPRSASPHLLARKRRCQMSAGRTRLTIKPRFELALCGPGRVGSITGQYHSDRDLTTASSALAVPPSCGVWMEQWYPVVPVCSAARVAIWVDVGRHGTITTETRHDQVEHPYRA